MNWLPDSDDEHWEYFDYDNDDIIDPLLDGHVEVLWNNTLKLTQVFLILEACLFSRYPQPKYESLTEVLLMEILWLLLKILPDKPVPSLM